jgi:hypothetical protein
VLDRSEFDQPTGRHAILVEREVKVCNLMTYMRWFAAVPIEDRRVALDTVGDTEVSTVFLGVNCRPFGAPHWFETMLVVRGHWQCCGRYSSWEEAQAGHLAAVATLKAALV